MLIEIDFVQRILQLLYLISAMRIFFGYRQRVHLCLLAGWPFRTQPAARRITPIKTLGNHPGSSRLLHPRRSQHQLLQPTPTQLNPLLLWRNKFPVRRHSAQPMAPLHHLRRRKSQASMEMDSSHRHPIPSLLNNMAMSEQGEPSLKFL